MGVPSRALRPFPPLPRLAAPDAAVLPENAGVRFSVEVLERTADTMTARVSAASDACPAPTTVTLHKVLVR